MANKQALEAQISTRQAELRAIGQQLNALRDAGRDGPDSPEFDRLLTQRAQLRAQISEISGQLQRLDVSGATSFSVVEDPNTGGLQIRTADGVFAGRGSTVEEAVRSAESLGARSEFLNNLRDPRTAQGTGTVSAGQTTAAAQQANAEGADTQAPAPPDQSANATGDISDDPSTTVPSNADASVEDVPTTTAAPATLPSGTVGDTTTARPTPGTVPVTLGNQGPTPATQQGGANLDTPDENTNLVSYIYRAYEVTSSFRQGKFTQELKGAQIFFPVPRQSRTDVARLPDQSAAETARLQRQAGAQPQGTVAQSAGTTGVPIAATAAPGLLEKEGFTDSTGSSTDTSGPAGSSAEQVPATAPLITTPVAANIATAPAGGRGNEQALADAEFELNQRRGQLEQAERDLAQSRADPNLQDLIVSQSNAVERAKGRLAQAEEKVKILQNQSAALAPNTTVAPQQGAREY